MSDNRDKIETALSFFDSFYKLDNVDDFDDNYIKKTILRIEQLVELNDQDCQELIKKIKSIYAVYQPEGVGIIADYEHFDDWYNNLQNKDTFFWGRYKKHLKDKGFLPNVIQSLEDDTLSKLMSYLGDPNSTDSFSRKGLVIGDVQSGKTSNYIGLICKAVDAGYKVIFLLTGTIESLRQQTQIRVEEGFIGYDVENSQDVGVEKGDILPYSFTTRNKDFVKGSENNTALLIRESTREPYIFIIKKNVSVLKKIYSAINKNLRNRESKVKFPMLMIDDECDNASINTKKEEDAPTQTNKHIRNLLNLFEKSNYVGFTATPFANVFIDPNTDDEMLGNDLFPKDFIFALSPPSNYNGAKKMFLSVGNDSDSHMLKIVDKTEQEQEELYNAIPLGHKQDFVPKVLPQSLQQAIDRFLIVNAIRDCRDSDKCTHRSMLINVSSYKKVQFVVGELVKEYLKDITNDIKHSLKLTKKEYLSNPSVARLYDLFGKEYLYCGIEWNDLISKLYNSIKNIIVLVVNSDKTSQKLDYTNKNGCRVIAIGGLALSRGLTLEGLMISYFYRNSATFDVLMQMGRWFGYRNEYSDLCAVYLRKMTKEYYKEIIQSTEELRQDMKDMCAKKKKPIQFGIRVRNNFYNGLRITASGKMRNTSSKTIRKHFWGEMFYTPMIDYKQDNDTNIQTTKLLVEQNLDKLDTQTPQPYLRDIDVSKIIKFLDELKINEQANDNFDTRQIIDFLNNEKSITKFDVLLINGSGEEFEFVNGVKIKPVLRKYNKLLDNTSLIQISHNRL
ncbi:MAG: Z1 domain-containing protein, partial [Firmicutes bacterium]|nr:Z1 domain-containing protein [Bacillota bacterium]